MRQAKTTRIVMWVFLMTAIAAMIAVGCGGNGNGNGNGYIPPVEPQYGGTLRNSVMVDPEGFDDAVEAHHATGTLKLTNEEVWTGDWAKGYAGGDGTDVSPWTLGGGLNRLEHKTGALAENVSWTPGLTTITLDIRPNVYWHNKPPTNGRLVTAEDVAYSLERQFTDPGAYMKQTYPDTCAATNVSVDGNTVILEIDDPQYFPNVIDNLDFMCIYPKDALELFGDMNNWEDSIGTGPFILTNFVSGDSITYVRNDNYWMTNPVGPGAGDQLPYIDGVLTTIVPDVTTADLLLMNGDLDVLTVTNYERAQNMLVYAPDLNYVKYMEDYGQGHIFFNTNEAPYNDERVRWALSLAINSQQILDTVYGGEGTLLKWPIMYFESYKDAYVPLEDLEDDMITVLPGVNISVADLYGHDPDLAEDLLDDAGLYRDPPETGVRFTAQIEFYDDPGGTFRPPLEMIVAMWADVGVDLEMVALSYSQFLMTIGFRGYDDMFYGTYSGIGSYYRGINYCGDQRWNASFIDDSTAEAARDAMIAAYPDEAAVDAIHQELMPYLLGKAYVISPPTGYYYRFWWPWVRNYNGEASVGYYNGGNYAQYIWIDQGMKEYMGYD